MPTNLTLYFETHSSSVDNEAGIASGQSDPPLSLSGEDQANDLGRRYLRVPLRMIFCSDLQRSYRTAEIAFHERKLPIVRDPRLRECDYGDWTHAEGTELNAVRERFLREPFPGGESHIQAVARVRPFLEDLRRQCAGQQVMIIGHRATHYALDHLLLGKDLRALVLTPFRWQPGWRYDVTA